MKNKENKQHSQVNNKKVNSAKYLRPVFLNGPFAKTERSDWFLKSMDHLDLAGNFGFEIFDTLKASLFFFSW